jgi:hypothetical protein
VTGSAPLFAFEAGLLAGWRFLPAWTLFGRADALFQTTRPDFTIDGASSGPILGQVNPTGLFEPSAVTGRGTLGVELRF